jgi:hypothetical protein
MMNQVDDIPGGDGHFATISFIEKHNSLLQERER